MNFMNNNSENDLMKKVQALQREFAEIDIDHDSYVRREELYSYLDRKSGATFDRAVADEIFEHMDSDQNNNVTVNEFIKVYIEAEEMLMKKIEATKNNLQNYRIQQEDSLKKANEEKFQEQANPTGIAHNSVVHITILEGNFKQPIGLGGPSNPYVEISLDDQQRVKTRSVLGGQNAVWDEQVTLDVMDPGSVLRFVVFDSKNIGDQFQGEIAVHISDLGDQSVHDVFLNLFDQTGQREIGKLHVNLQWIHSKARYYEMVANKWAENISKEQEDLNEYERYLNTLYMPFPTLRTGQNSNVISQSGPTLLDTKVLGLMTRAARNITKENPSSTFWQKILTLACYVEILLAIFISFGRTTYLEILLSAAIILDLRHGAIRNIVPLKRVAIGMLVSAVFYDFIWLAIYSGNWTSIESYDVSAEKGTRSFTVFFSYVNILVKVFLGIICYTFSLHTSS